MIPVLVVIPYFQRQPGLLRAAVDSVAAQRLGQCEAIDLVVVDDGSPHPAAADLAGVTLPAPHRLRVLRQPNGGPGAARNAGLAAATAQHRYVALLDSDDRWHPTHLAEMLAALEHGFDFFFCDHGFTGDYPSCFAQRAFAGGSPVAGLADVFAMTPAAALDAFLRCCPGQTSTVGWRRAAAPGLRFRTDLDPAEDLMFFCDLLRQLDAVCYSTRVNVTRGRGVSIYVDSLDWDSPGAVRRICNELRMRRALLAQGAAGQGVRAAAMGDKAAGLERELCQVALRALLRGRPGQAVAAWPAFRDDPPALLRLPGHLAATLRTKLAGEPAR